ncbi:hypothetical protein JCM24511_08704 [Saitozyma sp. JCM 24511]|nr:hypothetical protein JCM24511_08704 [Saitozyma sp. JCM 24511]
MKRRLVIIGIGGASCSGKTLLAKHIRRALPSGATIIHQDDFAPPVEQVPYSPDFPDLQDWDDPPTCILWPEFRDTLRHVRSTGVLPELHQSHDHLNKQVEVEIDSGVFERARATFTQIEADSHARGESIVWYIVDGFVLFWDKAIVDMLDIRIFLRVPHDILKQRRDERQVYVLQNPDDAAAGGVWVDPPNYFTNIVYPAYVKAHAEMFESGDVENGQLATAWEDRVEVLRPLEGAEEMTKAFESSCEAICQAPATAMSSTSHFPSRFLSLILPHRFLYHSCFNILRPIWINIHPITEVAQRSAALTMSSSPPNKPDRVKRGYRACLHCRSRKAKCDLGDIDAPSSPPCSRCRRESRQCVFAPSRRGGNNVKRKKEEIEEDSDMKPPSAALEMAHHSGPYPTLYSGPLRSSLDYDSFPPYNSNLNNILRSPQTNPYPHLAEVSPVGHADPPSAGPSHTDSTPRLHMPHPPSRTPSPKRRRLHLNPPLHAADPSSIVVADMQNESDALHILALASGQARDDSQRSSAQRSRSESKVADTKRGLQRSDRKPKDLGEFALIKLGIVSVGQVMALAEKFFRFHHHLFPMVPSAIIPRTQEQLGVFAGNERYLLAAIIIIASRHDPGVGMRSVHDRSWAVMRGWISDIQCLGAPPTIGLVEALLLLAENLPRDPARTGSLDDDPDEIHAIGFGEEVHGAENRQAWMLIGMAIRSSYGLGIDKLATKMFPDTERTLELERARLAWTYCYLFDRHVSLRLGKAFWSRGPSICFQGFSASAQTGPTAAPGNFPFLREIKSGDSPQEDFASLVQAYVELTQMMSNAHDILYPNAARTRSLVLYGEYFKFLDEAARSLDGFKVLWRKKKWTVFPLNDAVWAMFYYTQLYICAFSFQAHVERASIKAEEEYKKLEQQRKAQGSTVEAQRPPLSLFPRGAAASPDARYILQSCDAARTLLHICVDSLHPGGALPFLPSRYLLWFTYAAIFLLKALYSGAMLRADHAETLKLIDRLCTCFAQSATDGDHPATRYGHQLESLRKKLSGLSDATTASSPTGGHTVPLPPMSGPSAAPSVPFVNEPEHFNVDFSPSGAWTFPVPQQPVQQVSFPYPNTPATAPNFAQPVPGVPGLNDFAGQNDLGFVTLDGWFSQDQPDPPGFADLDLQDFWMKVGPGEAEGGFPFR